LTKAAPGGDSIRSNKGNIMKSIIICTALAALVTTGCSHQQMNQGAATDTGEGAAYTTGTMQTGTDMEPAMIPTQTDEMSSEQSDPENPSDTDTTTEEDETTTPEL
jgi:hypothetical protein